MACRKLSVCLDKDSRRTYTDVQRSVMTSQHLCFTCSFSPEHTESMLHGVIPSQGGNFSMLRPRVPHPVQVQCQHRARAAVEQVSGQSSVTANQHVHWCNSLRDMRVLSHVYHAFTKYHCSLYSI